MNPPLFPFISRTAPVLPAELFVGGNYHSFLPLERTALGYQAVFDGSQAALMHDEGMRRRGIAVRDVDAPTLSPRFMDLAGNWWSGTGAPGLPLSSGLSALSFTADPPWPLASISSSMVALLKLGVDPATIATAVYVEIMDRVPDAAAEARLRHAIEDGADRVVEALYQLFGSGDRGGTDRSLVNVRGQVFAAMLRNLGSFVDQRPAPGEPRAELAAGWWPRGDAADAPWWMGYSAALVLSPGRPGDWRLTARRAAVDPGIAIRRWRVAAGIIQDHVELVDGTDALDVTFSSANGGTVLIELEARNFFTPAAVDQNGDRRSLAIGFGSLDLREVTRR